MSGEEAVIQKTVTEIDYSKLSSNTRMAIVSFEQVLKLEKKAEAARDVLTNWVQMLPSDEMNAYITATTQIQERYEEEGGL